MREPVKVACAQVEPVLFDRAATIDRIAEVAAEIAGNGAQLVLFPEAFIPAYPSNRCRLSPFYLRYPRVSV